jgi:radical SAM superfamily enzyme YgiQ (UPF0313 family)
MMASMPDESAVTLVRGPIVSTARAINNEATPCISFAYIAAYLRAKGHRVEVVDAVADGLARVWPLERYPGYRCQGLTFPEIVDRIPRDSKLIGFSAMFSGEWPVTRDLIAAVRARFPTALIVAGGEHVTALPEYCLSDCPAIDVCVRGEGERTLHALLEAPQQAGRFEAIDGIAYRDAGGNVVSNGGLPRIREIDSIPWPAWPEGYLEKFWAAGKSYGVASERDMPVMASRGCPYRCTFCSSPQMWTTRYTLRDPADLVAEIKAYIRRYDITGLQFYDLTAVTKKRWAVEFCNLLMAEGIRLNWSLPSGTRSEALDEEVLRLFRRTGCNYLVYAPESGSAKTLQRIKKRISLPRLTRSAMLAKRLGIRLRTNLIIGFPGETRRDLLVTVAYGLKLAARGVDEVSINIFSPYPGTEIFADLSSRGQVALNDRYFLQLASLNSDYSSINPLTVNEFMGAKELAFYRLCFMLLNYAIGYVIYPWRILRTIRNVLWGRKTATVLEHRLKDMLKRSARPA